MGKNTIAGKAKFTTPAKSSATTQAKKVTSPSKGPTKKVALTSSTQAKKVASSANQQGKKNAEKPPSSTLPQPSQPSAKGKVNKSPSPSPSTSVEQERLNVLEDLSSSQRKDVENIEDEDRDWSRSLGSKIKRVPFITLKEQTIALMNSVMSYSVLGQRHPALDLPAAAVPIPIVPYPQNSSIQQAQNQHQIYIAPPAVPNISSLFQSIQPTPRAVPTSAASSSTQGIPNVNPNQQTPTQQSQQSQQSQQLNPSQDPVAQAKPKPMHIIN